MSTSDYLGLRDEFLRLLTEDSETKDRRRKEYNCAIFMDNGHAVFHDTDLDMILDKFDAAVKNMGRKF